jgi:2-haloacid dehalogenase
MREKLLAAYEELDAYADVAPVLAGLRANGLKTAILSNGSPAMLENAVRAAGIQDLFDAILSVDSLRFYKPRPAVYGLVAKRFGTAAQEVVFVSSNRWDVAGAKAFGFKTVWVNRTSKPDEYTDLPPDRIIGALDGLL